MPDAAREQNDPDLLVIGLGLSGTVALEAARSDDAHAVGIESNPPPADGGIPGGEYGTRAWGIFSDGTIACTDSERTTLRAPRAVLVATGAIDLPLPIPGWHLPGAIGVWHAVRTLPEGARVVVVRGPHAGSDHCKPDLSGFTIIHDEDLADGNAVRILGNRAVDRILVGASSIETAHVLLDNGLQPENALARMAGIPALFSPSAGGDVITPGRIFAVGGTLISVIGEAAGVDCDPDTMIQEATDTASLLTESLTGGDIPRSIPSARPDWDHEGVPTLPAQTTPETLVCPGEGVTVADVRDAIERGAMSVNDVKRRTRAAMSVCQGRDCLWTIRALLAKHNRNFTAPMTARPPASGITVANLAALAEH